MSKFKVQIRKKIKILKEVAYFLTKYSTETMPLK